MYLLGDRIRRIQTETRNAGRCGGARRQHQRAHRLCAGEIWLPSARFRQRFNTESRRPDGYKRDLCPARLFRLPGDQVDQRQQSPRVACVGCPESVRRNVIREDIQLAAIAAGVLAVVITGGMSVSAKVRGAAQEAGTHLVSSRFDTATSAMLARGAVRVEQMIDAQPTSFSPETPIRAARQVAANSPQFVFPVLEEGQRLVGILSKSGFLRPLPRRLILVDHNELSQAVKGAGELPIIEVLDHHRVSGLNTDIPILFWNNPLGSTCTLVTLSYEQQGDQNRSSDCRLAHGRLDFGHTEF
jgi:hypothetical protein